MNAPRPFARIYYVDLERDYPAVYHDDALFATFTRLHCRADAMWPAVPELPRTVRPAPLARLIEYGLVERVGPYGFQMKGYAKERGERQRRAKEAADKMWASRHANADADAHADAYANAQADAMPTPTPVQTTPDSPSPAKRGKRKDGTNPRAQGTSPRQNGHSPRQEKVRDRESAKGDLERLSTVMGRPFAEFRPVPKPGSK